MFIRIKGHRTHQTAHFDTQNFKNSAEGNCPTQTPFNGPLQMHLLPIYPTSHPLGASVLSPKSTEFLIMPLNTSLSISRNSTRNSKQSQKKQIIYTAQISNQLTNMYTSHLQVTGTVSVFALSIHLIENF